MGAAENEIAIGTMVAERYRIDRILGEGGMGVVYAAEHIHMRKEVALKVLHGEMCEMPDVVARFEREAVAAANIDHPNVAGATDFGRLPSGAFYLVLELLKGTSLRDEIAKGPIPLERALVILRGIANGVAAAHGKGIVHRDLKPENVMLVERDGMPDFVKVLDFGIAKLDATLAESAPSGGPAIVTRVGAIYGTPEYMAPEQAVGDKVDARADIFALGVVFLEMLTGQCPFSGQILNVLRERILMTAPLDMSTIASEGAKALITKMLQRQADDRVQTASDLLAAIDGLETPEPPPAVARSVVVHGESPKATAVTASPSTMPALHGDRPRWLVPAAIGAIALIFVVAIGFGASGGKDEPKRTSANAHARPVACASLKNIPPALRPPPPPPPPPAPPPAPEPAADTEPEPTPTPSASAAPTPPHNPKPKQRPRKTGPGGIYIPPPDQWFK